MIGQPTPRVVDNSFYDELGSRWTDDPSHAIALLAAEAPAKLDYVLKSMRPRDRRHRVIDIGCGAGFLAIPLAEAGHDVHGVDRSQSTLDIAGSLAGKRGVHVTLSRQDALTLDEDDASYDTVLLLDVLEHVEDPRQLVSEAIRVARPGGQIFFHTFNRNAVAFVVAVIGPRVLARHCPRDLHVYRYLVRPRELRPMFSSHGATVRELRGLRPQLATMAFLRTVSRRRVDPSFGFTVAGPPIAGYVGFAVKEPRP